MTVSLSSVAHKVRQATRLVRIWSPWWNEYLARCDFSYVSTNDVPSIQGLSNLVMVANTDFVVSHDIMDVAVALEFSLQQSLRSMDSRAAQYLRDHPNTREDVIAVCQAMEINSDMAKKFDSVTEQQWKRIAEASVDSTYSEVFDTDNPPRLPQGSILPEHFGFPDGLTAEKYIVMLEEKNRQEEEDFLNQDTDENSSEDSSDSSDSDSGEDSDCQQDSSDGDSHSHQESPGDTQTGGNNAPQSSTSNEHQEDLEGYQDDQPGSQDDSEQQVQDSMPPQQESSEDAPEGDTKDSSPQASQTGSGDGSRETPQGEGKTPQSASSGSSGASGSHDVATSNDLTGVAHRLAEKHDTVDTDRPQSKQHQAVGDSDSEKVENPWDNMDRIPSGDTAPQPQGNIGNDDHMSATEAALADAMDDSPVSHEDDNKRLDEKYQHLLDRLPPSTAQHNLSIPSFSHQGSASGVNKDDKKVLDKKIAQDIKEYSDNIPTTGGFSTGEDFLAWSQEVLRPSVVSWQKVFRRILGTYISRAHMSGTSDLSYAKQNPNQQPNMPIMMGFITYPPEVTVLIDASPSMVRDKKDAMSEFVGLTEKVLLQYSQPITVAAADSNIQYVTHSTSPARNTMNNIGKTFSGSSAQFGETVKQVARKGVRFRGRHYPKPDILVIFTDCLFPWPLENNAKLPLSYATVIVASTRPYDEVERFLPKWVKKNRNFVYINS